MKINCSKCAIERLQCFLSVCALFYAATAVSATSDSGVAQKTTGDCSNNITIIANGGAGTHFQLPDVDCISKKGNKLNLLEAAEYQLLITQNPTELAVSQYRLMPIIGQNRYSLWVELENLSSLGGSNIMLKDLQSSSKRQRPTEYAYITSEYPEAIFRSKVLNLPAKSKVLVLAADSDWLKHHLPLPAEEYCLYDISLRASDRDVVGYPEAQKEALESGVTGASNTESRPIAFWLEYVDIFSRKHSKTLIAYLRFAQRDSSLVFYPSRKKLDKLFCVPID